MFFHTTIRIDISCDVPIRYYKVIRIMTVFSDFSANIHPLC